MGERQMTGQCGPTGQMGAGRALTQLLAMGDSGRKGRGWLDEEGLTISSDLTVSSDLRKG